MAAAGALVLAFPDRKQDGRFPVRDSDGRAVAFLAVKWGGGSFRATDAVGRPLCEGRGAWGGSSRTWRATGQDRRPLLRVKRRWTGTRAEVTLERGGTYLLRGSGWKRDFTVTDADGAQVLSAEPRTSAWSFHPHDYVVRQAGPVLELAEAVAVVRIWRMMKKAESAAAG